MVGTTLCGNVGIMILCDEVGGVDCTAFNTADAVEEIDYRETQKIFSVGSKLCRHRFDRVHYYRR